MEQRKKPKKTPPGWSYHGKANIRFLQGWAIVGAVPCHSHHLPLVTHGAVDDSCRGNEEFSPKGRLPAWIRMEKPPGVSPWGSFHPPFTRVCLSVGDERASTRSLGQILSSCSCSTCQEQQKRGVNSPPGTFCLTREQIPTGIQENGFTTNNAEHPSSFLIRGKEEKPAGFGKLNSIWETQQDLGNPL